MYHIRWHRENLRSSSIHDSRVSCTFLLAIVTDEAHASMIRLPSVSSPLAAHSKAVITFVSRACQISRAIGGESSVTCDVSGASNKPA